MDKKQISEIINKEKEYQSYLIHIPILYGFAILLIFNYFYLKVENVLIAILLTILLKILLKSTNILVILINAIIPSLILLDFFKHQNHILIGVFAGIVIFIDYIRVELYAAKNGEEIKSYIDSFN